MRLCHCLSATSHAVPMVHAVSLCVLCAIACPGLVLVLAKLCVHMETTTVPYVVEVLVGAFQGRGLAGSDGPPRFVGGEVARRLGSTASESQALCCHTAWLHSRPGRRAPWTGACRYRAL